MIYGSPDFLVSSFLPLWFGRSKIRLYNHLTFWVSVLSRSDLVKFSELPYLFLTSGYLNRRLLSRGYIPVVNEAKDESDTAIAIAFLRHHLIGLHALYLCSTDIICRSRGIMAKRSFWGIYLSLLPVLLPLTHPPSPLPSVSSQDHLILTTIKKTERHT